MSNRDRFFEKHEDCQSNYPIQIHDATDEKKRHQKPTAHQAERAMIDSHSERAGCAVTPVKRDELERATAMLEASML